MLAIDDPGLPSHLAITGTVLRRSGRARSGRLHISNNGLHPVIDVEVLDPHVLMPAVSKVTRLYRQMSGVEGERDDLCGIGILRVNKLLFSKLLQFSFTRAQHL
jgi:hypothetical protein